jgi:hypothetical protein
MKARIKWVENVVFMGESGSGHTIVMDGPEEHGGHRPPLSIKGILCKSCLYKKLTLCRVSFCLGSRIS